MSQTVEVAIYGQRYTVRGEAAPFYVVELARQVDEQMRTLAAGMKAVTPTKAAVLTALNLAHELHQARRLQQESVVSMDKLAEGLLESIEETLGGTR